VTVTIASVLSYAAKSQDQRERNQLVADAEKLARKARMSQKRFCHIKVKAYADGKQWTSLKELGETRQLPIGYKQLARAAIKGYHGDNRDAYINFFIQKLSSVEEKYDMFSEAGMWKQAMHLAERELKDIRRVKLVKDRCNDKTLQLEADQAMGRLAT
jgi:vacuolar protein sorting-associated protein 16